MRFIDNYISGIFKIKKTDIFYTDILWDRYGKRKKNSASICGYKNSRCFSLRTVMQIENLWKVHLLFNMKKYDKNTFAINIFF